MPRRWFVLLVAAAVLTAGSAAVAAVQTYRGYPTVNVRVNGVLVESAVPAIIMEGTTLLPLRAVAQALGAEVIWDAATNTARVNMTPAAATPAPPAPPVDIHARPPSSGPSTDPSTPTSPTSPISPAPSTAPLGSRQNPAPLDTPIRTVVNLYGDYHYTAEVTLLEATRGEEAAEIVRLAFSGNTPPDPGQEYIAARIRVKVLETAKPGVRIELNRYIFTAVSGNGVDYDWWTGFLPSPKLETGLYQDGTFEGWDVYSVAAIDQEPLITFNRNLDGSGGVWFKTVK